MTKYHRLGKTKVENIIMEQHYTAKTKTVCIGHAQ